MPLFCVRFRHGPAMNNSQNKSLREGVTASDPAGA